MSQQATELINTSTNEAAASQDGTGARTPAQIPNAPPVVVQPQPAKYFANIYPGLQHPLPSKFVDAVHGLERTLNMPLWLLLQNSDGEHSRDQISEPVRKALWVARKEMPENTPVALLLDSSGGYSQSAYQMATLIRRHCGEFTVIVPRYAKSAATLLALGASTIILNKDAELGPLDVQIVDFDREERTAALDEVQMLERLHASALESVDQTMMLLTGRTGKKLDTILPHALKFAADMMRPMLEKVDVVHYTQRARALKVAEEYAIRLLKPKYSKDDAERIARRLVEKYPEHEFVIDVEEMEDLGLKTERPSNEQIDLMDEIVPFLGSMTAIGQLQEVKP